MEKLDFREISEKSELECYLLRFHDYVGVKLPEEYVKRCKVVGVFLHNRLVGGYMLVSDPPFRSLLFVPDTTKRKSSSLSSNPDDFLEVNGLWLSAGLKSPELQLAVWFHLVANIFLCKKKFVLLLRNSQNQAMKRLMNLAKPELLYDGAPQIMAGESTHERIQVSVTSRWNILMFSYKYWFELKERQRRARSFQLRFGKFTKIHASNSPNRALVE